MVNLIETETGEEDGEIEAIGDDQPDYEEEPADADEGILLSLVIQRLMLTPRKEEQTQRNNIFRTRCTVNQRVCDVIIDGGSGENVVSEAMVRKLGLKTEKHPSPYKIGWIKRELRHKFPRDVASHFRSKNTTQTRCCVMW
jgi:hypothetical protein